MCAGAGGQALGLHNAGFKHTALIEIDEHACKTLHHNNNKLNLGWGSIIKGDLKIFAENQAEQYRGTIDLVAGGVPCPPFSKAGKQLGNLDERDLFPTALEIVKKINPRAVLLENVAGLMDSQFSDYRDFIRAELHDLGYKTDWQLLNASDYGVPQLRPRFILVALKNDIFDFFKWPAPIEKPSPTVGEALFDVMSSKGWPNAEKWRDNANTIAPTLVGGSKKHGGPDLGPARAKAAWKKLGVNANRVGDLDEIPDKEFKGVVMRNGQIKEGFSDLPLLNVRMAARIQGFPDYWDFTGGKTNAYRQVGNAFPPPVAEAIGKEIASALQQYDQHTHQKA